MVTVICSSFSEWFTDRLPQRIPLNTNGIFLRMTVKKFTTVLAGLPPKFGLIAADLNVHFTVSVADLGNWWFWGSNVETIGARTLTTLYIQI